MVPLSLVDEFPGLVHFGFLSVPGREGSVGFSESAFDLTYRGLVSSGVVSSLQRLGATRAMLDDLFCRLVVGAALVRAAFGSACRSFLVSVLPHVPARTSSSRAAPSSVGHVVCEGLLCHRRAAVGAVPRLSSGSREHGPRCVKCYLVSHGIAFSRALRLRLGRNITLRRRLAFSTLELGSFISRYGRDIFGRARPAAGAVAFALRASGLSFRSESGLWSLSSSHVWSPCSCSLQSQCGLEAVRSVCPSCRGIRIRLSSLGGSCGFCGLQGVTSVCAACAVSFHVVQGCIGLCSPPSRVCGLWLCPECVVLAAGVVSSWDFDSSSLGWVYADDDATTGAANLQFSAVPPEPYPVRPQSSP